MNKRCTFFITALLGVLMFAAAVQAKTVFRVSITLDPSSHYHQGLEHRNKLLKERTQGEIELDIYHPTQPRSARDALEGAPLGTP